MKHFELMEATIMLLYGQWKFYFRLYLTRIRTCFLNNHGSLMQQHPCSIRMEDVGGYKKDKLSLSEEFTRQCEGMNRRKWTSKKFLQVQMCTWCGSNGSLIINICEKLKYTCCRSFVVDPTMKPCCGSCYKLIAIKPCQLHIVLHINCCGKTCYKSW